MGHNQFMKDALLNTIVKYFTHIVPNELLIQIKSFKINDKLTELVPKIKNFPDFIIHFIYKDFLLK